jgi:hypothetical protein
MFTRAVYMVVRNEHEILTSVRNNGILLVSDDLIHVYDNEKGQGKPIGYYRVYADMSSRSMLFSFQQGRKIIPADWGIHQFKGAIQASSWIETPENPGKNDILRAGSMISLRSRFQNLQQAGLSGLEKIISVLQDIHAMEEKFRADGLSGESRRLKRYELIQPRCNELYELMESERKKEHIHPRVKGLITDTIRNWDLYTCHLAMGDMEADHKMPDHGIPLLGHSAKNYLTAPSVDAAVHLSKIYSLATTYKWRGLDPFRSFKTRLLNLK